MKRNVILLCPTHFHAFYDLKNGVVVDHPKFLNLTAQNYTDHTISDLLVKFPHSPILL